MIDLGGTTAMHLRVVTLNVWNDEGDPRRTKVINAELRRLDPDLVALQEVLRTPDFDQLAALVDGTGLHTTHEAQVLPPPEPKFERYGGNAIASRWPHRVVETLDLPGTVAVDAPWRTLAALVPLPDLGELLVITPTISYQLEGEAVRERQAMAIADLDARHRTALPTIIAGDFNATPDSASIRYLTGRQSLDGHSVHYHDAWAVAGSGDGYTWSADNPNATQDIEALVRQPDHRRRIDYVFVGSPYAHRKAYARIRAAALAFDKPTGDVWPSDHFGLAVDLDVGLLT